MKRALADVSVFALLFGLLQLVHLLDSIYLLLAVPVLVGFIRGIVERRFLKHVPKWLAAFECGLVVLTSDIILCALSSKGAAPDNFWTIFGAFFLIFILPSVPLSIGGFLAAMTLQMN